jgi:hypothetical protein
LPRAILGGKPSGTLIKVNFDYILHIFCKVFEFCMYSYRFCKVYYFT